MIARWMLVVMVATVAFMHVSCFKQAESTAPAAIGGDYGPVSEDELNGVQTWQAAGNSGAKFTWVFSGDHFEIKGNGEPIPVEVLEAVLGKEEKAQVIEGKWKLADGTLTLSEIQADKRGGYRDAQLKPFRTPVVRVNFGETQYVLAPKKG